MTRLERIRSDIEEQGYYEGVVLWMSDALALLEAAEAVVKFSDLEPDYKGGEITDAAKKLMEEV